MRPGWRMRPSEAACRQPDHIYDTTVHADSMHWCQVCVDIWVDGWIRGWMGVVVLLTVATCSATSWSSSAVDSPMLMTALSSSSAVDEGVVGGHGQGAVLPSGDDGAVDGWDGCGEAVVTDDAGLEEARGEAMGWGSGPDVGDVEAGSALSPEDTEAGGQRGGGTPAAAVGGRSSRGAGDAEAERGGAGADVAGSASARAEAAEGEPGAEGGGEGAGVEGGHGGTCRHGNITSRKRTSKHTHRVVAGGEDAPPVVSRA